MLRLPKWLFISVWNMATFWYAMFCRLILRFAGIRPGTVLAAISMSRSRPWTIIFNLEIFRMEIENASTRSSKSNQLRNVKTKRRRSDSVLWQKPLHPRKYQKGKVTTQTPQKGSIKQRLRTDLGRSVGVTTATQLVWLTWYTGPTFPLPATAV